MHKNFSKHPSVMFMTALSLYLPFTASAMEERVPHSANNSSFDGIQSNTNRSERAEQVVRDVLKTQSPIAISPLQGGLSGSSLFKATVDNKDLVVRFISHRSLEEREREFHAQHIASEQGYGPYVHYSNVPEGIIVMDFLKGQPVTDEMRKSETLYVSLGLLLKDIHSGPAFKQSESVFQKMERSLDGIERLDDFNLSKDEVKDILSQIATALEKNLTLAPTHRDLNPNNIINVDGKFFVIDFEFSAQGDPYFDLGTIGNFYLFDEQTASIFLTSYFGHSPAKLEIAKFYLMKQVSLLFYGIELFTKVNLDTVTLPATILPLNDVYMQMGEGKIDLETPSGKLSLALSSIQEVIKNSETNEFKKALQTAMSD